MSEKTPNQKPDGPATDKPKGQTADKVLSEVQKLASSKKPTAVQTTGHAWDGDLQEFNNPLPRWWLWAFYGTVVFALVYWLVFPAWPIGNSWTRGFASVTYTVDGEERTVPWNTRTVLLNELHDSDAAQRQREFREQVTEASYDEILSNPEMIAFARSVGAHLFGDNCAACHGRGGEGVMGLYPHLANDTWLWGGGLEEIEETILYGRRGFMPAFKETLNIQQLDDVAEYVLTLSGEMEPTEASERGREIFQGKVGGCYHCHGADGKGIKSQGAANLTNNVWDIANVPGQDTLEGKKTLVKDVIWNGVLNTRNMPAWHGRLSPVDIKILAVYVHQLGGGE